MDTIGAWCVGVRIESWAPGPFKTWEISTPQEYCARRSPRTYLRYHSTAGMPRRVQRQRVLPEAAGEMVQPEDLSADLIKFYFQVQQPGARSWGGRLGAWGSQVWAPIPGTGRLGGGW